MSKHLKILPAVVALLLSTACSNDDIDGVLADGSVAAQVTADISNGLTATRASIDGNSASFTKGDIIYMVANQADTYDYTLQSDESTWSATTPYYFQDFTSVSFQGWYSTTAATGNSISINTTSQSTNDNGWNEWDILATPAVSASAISPAINFTGDYAFQHIMSEVTFTFTAGTDVSNLEALKGYTLKNLITDATFYTQTCTLAAGSTTGNITQTVSATSETTEVTCTPIILVPQDVAGKLTLEVTYNGDTYTADLSLPSSATALAAGTHYAFNVSIDNTGLTIGSATIEAWTSKDKQDVNPSLSSTDYTLTEENGIKTYTVYTEDGLLAWSEYTRSGNWNTNCTLAKDITMSGSNWTVVGTYSGPYTGTFDGNGYTITGLTISASSDYQGLVGYLGSAGVVKNLTLADVSISVKNGYYIGAVVGENKGTVTACYATGEVSGDSYTGGVVGYNYSGSTITACYATGAVSGDSYTGGVVGWNNGTLTACYSTGEVSGDSDIGGVVGYNYYGSVTTNYWNNSTTSYGIGSSSSNDGATYVNDSDSGWQEACNSMNTALSGTGWQYDVNPYDNPPLTLVAQ